MQLVSVQIVRFVDSHFPGWVECELVDANGRLHVIRDKVPIFATEPLDAESEYPTPGVLRCEIVEHLQDGNGRELVRICTEKPDGIESTEGVREFTINASLLKSPNG